MRKMIPLFVFAVLASGLAAQVQALNTPYNSNNGQDGNMFDVTATNPITVHGFDVNLDPGTHDLEVYALPGASFQTDPDNLMGGWVLVGSATGVVSNGNDVPTRMGPLTTCVDIPAGVTTGFYVTVTSGSMNYTNGTSVGTVLATNGDLTIFEGTGRSYPFGSTFTTRNWNGTLYYSTPNTGGVCLPLPPILPPLRPFQINHGGYALDADGVVTDGTFPAITNVGINDTVNVNWTGVMGTPHDTAIVPGASLAPSVFNTMGNQTVNIDFLNPGLTWLNGGASITPVPFPGNFSFPISFPAPALATAQSIHFDPSGIDGFELTQGVEVEWSACSPADNFDSLQTGTTLPVGWANGSNGNSDWDVNSGGTSSSNTGPTAAFSPPNYVYCETSGSGGTSTFSFDTCLGDLANFPNFTGTLNFQLSRIGASIGTLNIYLDDGSGTFSTLLATYTGPDANQSQGGVEWSAESVTFLPTTQFFAFRFEYTAGGTFTGDIAVDDIVVQ